MATRKPISSSIRWSVFSRDGFTCRYCGAQAGQDGVELAVDHIISVADGGDNRIDNLITACRSCNGGKGAKSLREAPTSKEVVSRIHQQTSTLQQQAAAISASIAARNEVEQLAVNLKCQAYKRNSISMIKGEAAHISTLCKAYGSDLVLEWYETAANNRIPERRAIKYVYRNIRRKEEDGV